jgi:hypothetical protein
MNPLDWTAEPFLTLYISLACLTVLRAIYLRKHISEDGQANYPLTPLELAYLAGGSNRVGDAVLAGLLTTNAATVGTDGKIIHVKRDAKLSSELSAIARLSLSGSMTRSEFQEQILPVIDAIEKKITKSRAYSQLRSAFEISFPGSRASGCARAPGNRQGHCRRIERQTRRHPDHPSLSHCDDRPCFA